MGGGIDKVENTARGALTVTARVSNGASRYAMPTIPELVYAATLYKSAESPEYEKFVEGAKATNNDNLIFSFQRPDDTSGTFTLEVFAFVKAAGEGTTTFSRAGALFSGGKDGLAIEGDEIKVNDPIALSSDKQGTVSLKITVPEGCSLEIDDTAKTNFAVEGTSPDFILTQNGDGIPAGAYSVNFTVKKDGQIVYTFTESINVLNGLRTDTWSGQEKGEAKVITQSAISSTVFVRGESAPWYASNAPGATASDENSGTYLAPFATIQKAVDKIIAINDGTSTYTIYLDGTFTATSSAALADFAAPSLTQKLSVKIAGLSATEKAVLDGGDTACGIVVGKPIIYSSAEQKNMNLSLENLVIQNAKNTTAGYGGAIMLCCKAGNSHTIKNCEIKNNSAYYGSAIYNEYGSLDLQGCVISGNNAKDGTVYLLRGSRLTISTDVKIENNTARDFSGGVYVGKDCDFTMSGGTISGNSGTSCFGGGVCVDDGGTFTMTGGTISGGNAKIGGGVYVEGGGTFTMSGGTITGNTATTQGGGVYVAATSTAVGTFKMSGSASVPAGDDGKNDVYLSAYGSNFATITVAGDLTATSPIATITPSAYEARQVLSADGTKVTAITQDICDKFALSPNPAGGIWQIVPDGMGANGVLTRPDTIYLDSSNGSDTNSGLTASKAVKTLSKAIELYEEYDAQKIMVCAEYTLPSDESTLLDRAGKRHLTLMRYDGSSDVSDAFTGTTVISGNMLLIDQGDVTISNVTLDGNKDNVSARGSLLYIKGSDTTVTLGDGATLCNNKTSGDDGGVYIGYRGTFTMEGGAISGCEARRAGGVYDYLSSTFNMSGGIISGNTATENGGGAYIYASTFTLKGGTIGGTTSAEANTARNGGGVCVCFETRGTFTMEKGTISGNTATERGGGVYVYYGTVTMSDGTIFGNTAQYGGGVYNYDTFEMTGGEIKGNTATTQGGGVYNTVNTTFTHTGGTVSDNFLSDNTPDDVYPAP